MSQVTAVEAVEALLLAEEWVEFQTEISFPSYWSVMDPIKEFFGENEQTEALGQGFFITSDENPLGREVAPEERQAAMTAVENLGEFINSRFVSTFS